MSRRIRRHTPRHPAATEPAVNLATRPRHLRPIPPPKAWIRAEDARLVARHRGEAALEEAWLHSPGGPYALLMPAYSPLYLIFAVEPEPGLGPLALLGFPSAVKAAEALVRSVRTRFYRSRAGVDRAFARECAERLRAARGASRPEYVRILRALAAERERREAAQERQALSRRPSDLRRRAKARAKRDEAWGRWFESLERAVAGSGTPPREPGLPDFPDRPRRRSAPVRKLCAFSAKPAPTGDEVREQFEKARGRGRVEEKLRLGSMLLDAEATVDSSLVRNADGEIVGRNAGLRGWLVENCPELLPHYASLTGYRRLAWEARDAAELFDPVPASALLGPEPDAERRLRPALRERLPGARRRLRRLLAAPESATVAGFLRQLRAQVDARLPHRDRKRRLA